MAELGLNSKKYQEILEATGEEKTDLLGVLTKALHHNFPNTFHIGMRSILYNSGGLKEISEFIDGRIALVNRHMNDAQKALVNIYETAKRENYQPIIDIFERVYHVGHSK